MGHTATLICSVSSRACTPQESVLQFTENCNRNGKCEYLAFLLCAVN